MPRTAPRNRSRPKTQRPKTQRGAAAAVGAARLQKILAAAGLGSRRQCENLILEGRVEVDRKVVAQLGAKADPATQEVRVDGNVLPQPKRVYYLVHKPPGVLSTNRDPAGRPRVVDLLAPRGQRLFTVGRLDMSSEGLILATNDGELANLLTHPRYGVHKTYHVEVAGQIEREDLVRLEEGMYLAEGFARVVGARIKSRYKNSSLLEITLNEGRNREIRRLLARTGHKVLRLRRVAIGPLRLGEVPLGASRPLAPSEVKALWHATAPEARREREKQEKAQPAKQKSAEVAKAVAPRAETKPAESPKHERHEERPARGKPRAVITADDELVQFRLPRRSEGGGDGASGSTPQRRVVIGGDSSSYMPKPAGAPRKKPAAGVAAGATQRPRRAKAGRRPKPTGRPKRTLSGSAAGRVKRRGAGRGESTA